MIFGIAILVASASGCSDDSPTLAPLPVSFRVQDTTCATADVAWQVNTTFQRVTVDVPWTETIGSARSLVEIAATRGCNDSGSILVEIFIDGRLTAQGAATGPSAVAETSTRVY
jgi:hypothetical protein